ncbi:MAG: fused response regulator/thioredoxin-disulfide reductase, partial [Chloroflexia bacterium]|nr:fused response regulator/thioredoxin-disulfide reductase [Chloroflexia bacterium]
MAKPVQFAVDGDATSLWTLTEALERRFGADYRVVGAPSPEAGIEALERLAREGAEVALVVAGAWLAGMTGVEFLARAHACHPDARRVLLSTIGDTVAADARHRAMALGRLDLTVGKPWRFAEEQL